jgi:hypothetical protein
MAEEMNTILCLSEDGEGWRGRLEAGGRGASGHAGRQGTGNDLAAPGASQPGLCPAGRRAAGQRGAGGGGVGAWGLRSGGLRIRARAQAPTAAEAWSMRLRV